MRTYSYPCSVEEIAPGDFLISFAEIPEVVTGGPTLNEALAEAPDALAVAIDGYLDRGRELPVPRLAAAGEYDVALDPAVAARALLLAVMRDQSLTKVALGALMGRDEKVARRVVSGKGVTLDLTFAALRALGVRPGLTVPDAPAVAAA